MGGRLAPDALEHRLVAELNLMEGMEESLRQLTDVERTRAVALAQQESVSVAQILKVLYSFGVSFSKIGLKSTFINYRCRIF